MGIGRGIGMTHGHKHGHWNMQRQGHMQRRWRGRRQGQAYAVTYAQEGGMGTSKGLGYTCMQRAKCI